MGTWFDVTSGINIPYPIWLNGFEVRVKNLDRFFIIAKLPENQLAYVRCVNSTAFVDTGESMTFEKGLEYCQNQSNGSHMDSPLVNHTNLHMFSTLSVSRRYWIKDLKVGPFLNSEDLTVHCLVLKGKNKVWGKDNCTNKYLSICVNATVHDAIAYIGQESWMQNYYSTSSSTPQTSSAAASEFVTSLGMSETNGGVDLTTSAANTPFDLNNSTRDSKTEEDAKTSSIFTWLARAFGLSMLVIIVIIACLCVKRKQGNNNRTTFQQIELSQPSSVMQEGHDDNSVHVDVISDDITEREATPYTSLQMTEKHLYTALVGPSFVSTEMSYVNDRIAESDVMGSSVMSTETSYVNGRIAESDVPVEETFEMTERPENKYDEPKNNDPANTN
ncbi:uncharacterized protein LOC127853737 [Dreissena polymorpha]|nr:uncharacterized protein LOC127853737 [Dreissena polymorpha]